MVNAEDFIADKLKQREDNGSLRTLSSTLLPIDFCSNDYLGFARSSDLNVAVGKETKRLLEFNNGSGGSRLLSGNHSYTEETEQYIADFHSANAGLIFNSGYDANVGLLSSLGQKGDTFICDELIHASLIDGVRLTHANRYTFKHNNLVHLEEKLKLAKGVVYVIIESVYSMDGDIAPIEQIVRLSKSYGANLIVDEAHATGVFGKQGRGLVQELRLTKGIFARIVTFGKAIGCHGAIVLGSKSLRDYLINFARSFIYTTAAPLHNIIAIRCAYQMLLKTDYAELLKIKIMHFNQLVIQNELTEIDSGPSAIQTMLIPGNSKARHAAAVLQKYGFDVRPILSPTVPEGKERLRLCLHLYNTDEEIQTLVLHLKHLNKL
jgi:8-amino-7-oxononanoate synthase